MAKTIRQEMALVGGESLLGREMNEVLSAGKLPAELSTYSGTDDAVVTTEQDEAAILAPLTPAELDNKSVVFLAGSREASEKALAAAKKKQVLIDLSGFLEDQPDARLRAPLVEDQAPEKSRVQVIAHPAAIALALFFKTLAKAGEIRRSVVVIFEPASERGQKGIEELQKQTVGLLSFKKFPEEVFDAQLSFNLLAQYGEDAPQALEDIEAKIDRHLASLLAKLPAIPMPSIRLVQAPVFHGYSISVWVEMAENASVERLGKSLATAGMDVRSSDQSAPSNVGTAGQSGLTVGAITIDRNNARACWFWVVCDNLRMISENAREAARAVLA